MKKIILSLLVLLILPLGVSAAEFRANDEVSVSSSETIEGNFYSAGALIRVSGDVNGDAYVAGSDLTFSGDIRDDLVTAGANVSILGNVGDDLRTAGADISLAGSVGGEAIMTGALVHLVADSQVEQDLIISGAKVIIDGDVKGNVVLAAEEAEINGKISGSVDADVSKLTVGDGADITGDLTYRSLSEANVMGGARIGGELTHQSTKAKYADGFEKSIADFVRFVMGVILVSFIIAAVVLVLLFPKASNALVKDTRENFFNRSLIGLIVAIVCPIVVIILIGLGFGLPLGILLGFCLAVAVTLSKIMAGVTFGGIIYYALQKPKEQVNWWIALLGVLVLFIVMVIPIIGWLVALIFFLATLGSICNAFYKKTWLKRA